MKLPVLCFVAFFVSAALSENRFRYDGYKVYQVTPTTITQAMILKEFENDEHFDFWSEIRLLNAPVDIMVTPVAQQSFENTLKSESIAYTTIIDDVEENEVPHWAVGGGGPSPHKNTGVPQRKNRILKRHYPRNHHPVDFGRESLHQSFYKKLQVENRRQMRTARVARGNVTFTEFMRHDEILAYIEQIAQDYPNIAKTELIGKSFEGRNLTIIKISSGGSNKPIIFAEAAIHAREWIAPPVALYIINQLVENPDNAGMYQDVDWIIFPVVNPDGYEYSHTNTRLWRKTRTPGTICDGVDGNRNFDYQWMVTGASNWQCGQIYAGHSAFSEVETKAVGNYLLANSNIKLFLDIHSYGQWLLYPWGFTSDSPENVDELHSLGDRVNDAIYAVRGTNYTVGSSNAILYASSGGSRDFAKGVAGIELGYTVELPGGGSYGFDIEASEILPVITETWEGIKVFYQHIKDKYAQK